ncbi:hypothetical protein [Streptomyces bohaiensis]|uniref:hypothetical protein n=1 Tax=Streptomyces bohaiensis TaxID=1431344 RepID=UPI003B7E7547
MTFLLAASLLVGCTVAQNPDQPPEQTFRPPPSRPSLEVVPPEVMDGSDEFVSEGPGRGFHHFGAVPLVEGISWVAMNCRDDATATTVHLSIETVGEFGIACETNEVTQNLNQLNLDSEAVGQAQFTLDAPDSVEWYVSFQVPEGTEFP